MKVYDFIGIGTKDMPRLGDLLWSQPGLEQQMDHDWETLVSTRIGTEDRAYWETFCLNQDWNRGPTTTGKLFVSTRIGTEVRRNYKGKYFIRVFNLGKGGILPYKGVGIQYSEKWRREIIR